MKISFSFILCILILHATAFADDPCVKGKDALAKGDYIGAIEALKEGVRKDKKNAECALNLGLAYLKADSAEQAVSAFIQARELDTANAKIYEYLGDAYAKEGILTAAIEQWLKSASLDTLNADLHRKLAKAQLKIRAYPEAIAEFQKVLILDTTDTDAYRNVGHLYYRAEKFDKAAQYLKAVYTRNPKDSSRIEYSKALFKANYCAEHIPVAEAILKDDSSQSEVDRDLQVCYLRTGQKGKITISNDTTGLKAKEWVDRGKVAKGSQNDSIAIYSFEKAILLDSSYTKDIAYDLGSLYMSVKDWQNAVRMFDKKLALDTASNFKWACNQNAAISLMQIKEWEGARSHILGAIDAKPEYIPAWRILAQCYQQMDSTAPAKTAYKKMLEFYTAIQDQDEKDKYKEAAIEGYQRLGLFILLDSKIKNKTEAIELLKKALLLDPTSCQTKLWIAQGYALSNLRDDAKAWYCKVVSACGRSDPKTAADATKGLAGLGYTPEDCNGGK